jgi:serine/threonine protein kinase/Tol biopolymer transport system component
MLSGDFQEGPGGYGPGSVLAAYRLEALVGVGGMAAVWQARSLRLGRPVALKILAPALATDEAFRLRFIAEARAAALVDDPHIIPVYDADEADGVLFIAMRFVGGGDLRRLVEREGALPPGRAVNFISPVASALDAAHAAGLVHRDVKPANILVDTRAGRPDHVYLSDFGIAKAAASMNLTAVGQALGTPDYMAPEQIEGHAVDGRTDQYALACVTYRLLTEHGPFERESALSVMAAHLYAPPPSLAARRPDLPDVADQVLAKAMAKSPADRYESCSDFAEALRHALGLAPYIPRLRSAEPVSPRHPGSGPVTPHPPTITPSGPLTPPGPPAPTEAPASTERPAPVESSTPAGPSTPASAATPSAPAPAPVSADAPPPLTDPTPSPAATPPPAVPNTMTISPAHGVRRADIVARPEAPLDAEPGPATREADDNVGLRTPTVAARPSAPAPAAAPGEPGASEAPDESAGLDESAVLDEPGASGVSGESAALDESEALDGPGASEVSGESAALDQPDEPAVPESMAEAAVESEVQTPAPAAAATTPVRAAALGSPTIASAPADPGNVAETLVPGPGHVSTGEMSAATVATEPATTTETSAADDADQTGAPEEAPDPAELRTAYEPHLSKAPERVPAAVNVPTEDELTDPGRPSEAAPTIVLPPDGADRPDDTTHRTRHRRLSSVAAVCAVAVVAAVVPFVLISQVHSPGPAQSPSPTQSSNPGSSPGPSKTQGQGSSAYTRVAVNLPAAYRGGMLSSMAFSPTGTTLAIADGAGAGEACLWDIAATRCTANLPVAYSVAFSPDGKTLAATNSSASADRGTIRLWDVATGRLTTTLTDPGSQGGYSAAFSPNGTILAVADANGSTYLWHVANKKAYTAIVNPNHSGFTAVACSSDNRTLAAGDTAGITFLIDVVTKKEMFPVTITSLPTHPAITDPNPTIVNSVTFSPDGTTLAIGDINGAIALVNVETERLTGTLHDPGNKGVKSVAFSPDGATLAVADANGNTYLWNVATRKVIATLTDPGSKGVTSVAFSPNGKILATGDEDGSANLWYGNFRLSALVINVSCLVIKVSCSTTTITDITVSSQIPIRPFPARIFRPVGDGKG